MRRGEFQQGGCVGEGWDCVPVGPGWAFRRWQEAGMGMSRQLAPWGVGMGSQVEGGLSDKTAGTAGLVCSRANVAGAGEVGGG